MIRWSFFVNAAVIAVGGGPAAGAIGSQLAR